MREEKVFELRSTTLIIHPSNYVELIFKKNAELTLEDAIEINQLAYKEVEGKPFVIAVVSEQNYGDISSDALKHFTTDKKIVDIRVAQALVVKNLSHRLIASLYITLQKNKSPIKVFKNIEAAKEWLTEILDNHYKSSLTE